MNIDDKTSELDIRRGQYMCVEMVMPGHRQACIRIDYGLASSPFTREQAMLLAAYIRNAGKCIAALQAVDAFFSEDQEFPPLETVVELLDQALEHTQNV
ncbi:MAG: hypothetical protein JNM22_02000 [Saprospiraceae bacterium]|nr:hypothetical protein [Saprospiraceae bacterium]